MNEPANPPEANQPPSDSSPPPPPPPPFTAPPTRPGPPLPPPPTPSAVVATPPVVYVSATARAKSSQKFTYGIIIQITGSILFVIGIALSFTLIGACVGIPMAIVGFPLLIWGIVWIFQARAEKTREVIADGIQQGLTRFESGAGTTTNPPPTLQGASRVADAFRPSGTTVSPRGPTSSADAATPSAPGNNTLVWLLAGAGCLMFFVIIAGILAFMAYRAKKVTEFKSDFKSSLKSLDDASRALTDPNSVPKEQWDVYVNAKGSLPRSLQDKFIAFRFIYPKTFKVQSQSEVNFVKVEKYAEGGGNNTAENFAVGYASFNPPSLQSTALYDKLLDSLGKQIAGGFHNYTELRRIDVTVDGVTSRAALFQADFNDEAKTMIYGKTIVVHPPGKEKGVTILLLGTSLSRDVKSPDDLGVKGHTAEILHSFSFM